MSFVVSIDISMISWMSLNIYWRKTGKKKRKVNVRVCVCECVCMNYLNEELLVWYGLTFPRLAEDKEKREQHLDPLHTSDHIFQLGCLAGHDVLNLGLQVLEVGTLRTVVVNNLVCAQPTAVVQDKLCVKAFTFVKAWEAVRREIV